MYLVLRLFYDAVFTSVQWIPVLGPKWEKPKRVDGGPVQRIPVVVVVGYKIRMEVHSLEETPPPCLFSPAVSSAMDDATLAALRSTEYRALFDGNRGIYCMPFSSVDAQLEIITASLCKKSYEGNGEVNQNLVGEFWLAMLKRDGDKVQFQVDPTSFLR